MRKKTPETRPDQINIHIACLNVNIFLKLNFLCKHGVFWYFCTVKLLFLLDVK